MFVCSELTQFIIRSRRLWVWIDGRIVCSAVRVNRIICANWPRVWFITLVGSASRLRSTFKGKAQTVEDEIHFSRDSMEESEEGNWLPFVFISNCSYGWVNAEVGATLEMDPLGILDSWNVIHSRWHFKVTFLEFQALDQIREKGHFYMLAEASRWCIEWKWIWRVIK